MVYILLSVLFDGESLAQHLMLTGCELGILLYRTKFIIPTYEEFFNPARDAGWIVFCLIIIGLVSSDRTSDFKEAFEQKFILQKQKDDFEEILNSFPEAVLIVEDHQSDAEVENRFDDESAHPLDAEGGHDE